MSVSEWLAEATPDHKEVPVCFDRRLLDDLKVARAELDDLPLAEGTNRKTDEHEALEARVAELEERVRAKTRLFVFEGIGWGRWRDLLAKHPQADDQASIFARAVQLGFMPHSVENIGFNAETFVPAAISASCVEPGITVPEASTLLRKAPPGVIDRIWAAVLEVNLAGGADPFVPPVSVTRSDGAPVSAKR